MKTIKELQQAHVNSLVKIRQIKRKLFKISRTEEDLSAYNKARIKELVTYNKYCKQYE